MWAGISNPDYFVWFMDGIQNKTTDPPPVPQAWWGIVDHETTIINGHPTIDQYLCLCPSSEKQREVWEILNGIKKGNKRIKCKQ